MNPELRQTFNTFSHNLESANQTAQENIYTFTQLYIDPCLTGFKACLEDCTAPCFPNGEGNLRRRRGRGRSRGRAENFFDFYDDWQDEEDADTSAMAWGDDELDSLLAGSRSPNQQQPRRQRAMSYGSRGRRMGPVHPSDSEQDPTIIPSSSYLGFLERLPWRIGARVLRYKPSAANLQEHPGGLKMSDAEAEQFLRGETNAPPKKGHGRQRSDTQNSRSTMNSLSSRGDLIMSDEDDDAIAIDDEFALALGRRSTNVPSEDRSSGKTGSSGRRPGNSRRSTRTASSKSIKSPRSSSRKSLTSPKSPSIEQVEAQSLQELRQEEEQIRKEEEMEIQQKRDLAHRLAVSKGLSSLDAKSPTAEIKPDPIEENTETPSMTEITSPRPMSPEPVPDPRNQSTEPSQREEETDESMSGPP